MLAEGLNPQALTCVDVGVDADELTRAHRLQHAGRADRGPAAWCGGNRDAADGLALAGARASNNDVSCLDMF